MPQAILGFVLVLTRISAFFLVVPIFSWMGIPVPVKVAAIVSLGLFFSITAPIALDPTHISSVQAVLFTANEAVYGFALGLVASMLFSVVRFSTSIAEREMGLSMAQIMDPFTDEPGEPLSSLLEMIFIVLFFSANGHHLFLEVLSRSYRAFPVGSIPTISTLTGAVVETSSVMFTVSLRLAGPMLAAFLVLMVAMALLARLIPEMNIFFISLPFKISLGLIMAAVFLPFLNEFVAEFAGWMVKLVPI